MASGMPYPGTQVKPYRNEKTRTTHRESTTGRRSLKTETEQARDSSEMGSRAKEDNVPVLTYKPLPDDFEETIALATEGFEDPEAVFED